MNRQQSILNWAHDRNILAGSSAQAQFLKTISEVGELADNLNKRRYEAAKDDIGDILVTLIIIAEMIGTDLDECLEVAWHSIKDRKGRMVGGVFVKEGDE
jgi:NTP pyrophosphatase (non-canonical NTP hydrolase)